MEPHEAWAGESGLRIERLARPHHGGYTLAMEPAAPGEPMWLTPGHWRDLCAAAAELGPDWADPAPGAVEDALPLAVPAVPPPGPPPS